MLCPFLGPDHRNLAGPISCAGVACSGNTGEACGEKPAATSPASRAAPAGTEVGFPAKSRPNCRSVSEINDGCCFKPLCFEVVYDIARKNQNS